MNERVTKDEKTRLKVFEKSLGYSFKHKIYLVRALTHKSYANENNLESVEQNERLEFLGDAVLELAVSELLMERFPHFSEGELSKLRASIVNERQLAELGRRYRLGEFIYLGKGEEQTKGREKHSLLSDAYEAILGAVYLDRGFKKARNLIQNHYVDLLDSTEIESLYQDYKTKLQEVSQNLFQSIPKYHLAGEKGPDHEKIFEVHLFIQDNLYGVGMGRSKKIAEQKAAKEALLKIEGVR